MRLNWFFILGNGSDACSLLTVANLRVLLLLFTKQKKNRAVMYDACSVYTDSIHLKDTYRNDLWTLLLLRWEHDDDGVVLLYQNPKFLLMRVLIISQGICMYWYDTCCFRCCWQHRLTIVPSFRDLDFRLFYHVLRFWHSFTLHVGVWKKWYRKWDDALANHIRHLFTVYRLSLGTLT